jgi:hypothetical protein
MIVKMLAGLATAANISAVAAHRDRPSAGLIGSAPTLFERV